ncbi:MAG: acetyl-CoA hydrolase/transferase C-terminal domain-containing protein [Oscillospiraceae bacterium]|nr:acetyl-CoA hydrolase/transferase C-terminal domain-containing protein [Oscillospiraceae bacterium]
MPEKYMDEYLRKLCTAEQIAARICSGYVCAGGTCLSEPASITAALGAEMQSDDRRGILHHQTMSIYPSPFFDEKLKGRYSEVSWFSTPYARTAFSNCAADIMPSYYRDVPALYDRYIDLDVFYAAVSPMDAHGYFSFGTTGGECMALVRKARHIFLEVNKNMPRTFGDQQIHISQVELLCESDAALPEAVAAKVDDVSRAIGELIADEIPDGATIQLGIGSIPSAVGVCLKGKKDLGIHTELFSDSMVELIECGAVTNLRKSLHRSKSITTFAYGTKRVYDYLNDNVGVEFHSVSYVNDPAVIAQNDFFMSVNSCIEVDLWGQVASESIGTRHFSGTGGQTDFVRGAILSKGGRSFIGMPSTAKGGEVSRINPTLKRGAIVSTSKNDVDCIVTEYGVAQLRGCTARQRAANLIAVAHPKFREQLAFEASKINLV